MVSPILTDVEGAATSFYQQVHYVFLGFKEMKIGSPDAAPDAAPASV